MFRVALVAIATASTLVLSACSTSGSNGPRDDIGFVAEDGSAVLLEADQRALATELVFTTVDGSNTWTLSDHKGKVVLLNAWGPWCAPCRTELPELQKLYEAKAAEGLEIVGLATRTNEAAVDAFVSTRGIEFPQLADYDSAILSSLRGIPSSTVPGTIFIDRQGRIAGWALGANDPSLIRSLANALLEEQV